MSKEIQVSADNLLATTAPPSVFTHQGDNGVQIANQGTVNFFLTGNNGAVYNAATALSTEYYNLFVVGEETFAEPYFLIGKDRALTISESVSEEISTQFAALTPEAIDKIKTFPSLFASENRHYGRTDADHLTLFGVVTDVRVQENGIKIYFQRFCAIPQQRLNEIAVNLAIKKASSFNELNRTHWTIKRMNLVEELRAVGISVLIPT